MTRLASLVALILICASSAAASDRLAGQQLEACDGVCSEIVRMGGGQAHVVVTGADGAVYRVVPVDLPVDAVRMQEQDFAGSFDAPRLASGGTADGGSVEQITETYTTTTHIVVVTTTIYTNANGDIVDVQVNTSRFERDDQEVN